MNAYETEAFARNVIEDRVRQAADRRLARESGRSGVPAHARADARFPRWRSRLWGVLHLRHAYG